MVGRENRRVIRVRLEKPLTVIMGSIGSDVRYDLLTRDISNNGFFLDFEKPGRFPFTPASIMEVWMQLGEGRTVFFNGKMARVVYPTDDAAQVSGPGIAVRVVQIEADQERALIDFIRSENELRKHEQEPDEAGDEEADKRYHGKGEDIAS